MAITGKNVQKGGNYLGHSFFFVKNRLISEKFTLARDPKKGYNRNKGQGRSEKRGVVNGVTF